MFQFSSEQKNEEPSKRRIGSKNQKTRLSGWKRFKWTERGKNVSCNFELNDHFVTFQAQDLSRLPPIILVMVSSVELQHLSVAEKASKVTN